MEVCLRCRKKRRGRFQFQLVTEMEPDNASAWQGLPDGSRTDEAVSAQMQVFACRHIFTGTAMAQLKHYKAAGAELHY